MKLKTLRYLGLVAAVSAFLLFYRLGHRDLWSSHEARAAQDAQRIVDEGDWLLPRHFDGQLEVQKPPLYYWLVAAAGWTCGGVDAFAARLPAAVSGFAVIVLVFAFLARGGRPIAGALAALVMATAHHFTWIARTARIDVPLCLTTTLAILLLWPGRPEARSSTARSLVGYVVMAAGVLFKGPLGVVLPLAVVGTDALAQRRAVFFRSLLWGLPVILFLAGPWFVIAHVRTDGEFTRVFFWYHHVERATGGAAALAAHPWWFYGPRFAFDFLPWSPCLVLAGWLTFRHPGVRCDPAARLGLLWLATIVLLLSASRFKRADYLLPAYPGAAIWIGCVGERLYDRWRSPTRGRWLAVASATAVTSVVAGWVVFLQVVVPKLDAEREKYTLAAAVRSVAPRPDLVLLFRVEDHLLAFHLGRPLNTFLEWENLDVWVARPEPHHVIMSTECAAVWRQYITSGTLEEVLRYTDRLDRRRPRDLVLMRTCRRQETQPVDGPADRPTAGQQGPDKRAAAGLQPVGRTGSDR